MDAFFARAQSKSLDDELRADLAKHGVVLVCGFIERSVEVIILERLAQRAHPRVISFVKGHFKRGTNYDCEPICQLLERFDLTWAKRMREYIEANPAVAEGVGSAYTIRNSVAHGGDGSGGLNKIVAYYAAATALVDALIDVTKA